MWLAHALTLSRLPIAIALTQTFGDRLWSAALVLLAAATDAADGTVARAMQRRGSKGPDIGGWLDPLIDKLFVIIVLATLWWHTRSAVLIATIAAREIALAPLMLVYIALRRPWKQLHARPLGKAATIAQFLACAVAVVDVRYAWLLAIPAGVLGVLAVIDYLVQELRSRGRGTPSRMKAPRSSLE